MAGVNLRFTIPFVLALLGAVSVHADEKLPVLKSGTDIYSNVTVLTVTPTDVYFTYNNGKGMANAKLKDLSSELQKHFHYNPVKANEMEQKQAEANAEYDQEIAKTPPPSPPDESRVWPPADARASELTWGTDFPKALEQARAGGKTVLLDFTGSDWCPWCIKFDREVLETAQFAAYARNKLELVRVDFPRNKPQSEALKQANKALATKYHVTGFPTLVLVNDAGHELGRQVGYAPGGPSDFIAKLQKYSTR